MAPKDKDKDKIDEAKIKQVCEFTGVSPDDAKSAIKVPSLSFVREVDILLDNGLRRLTSSELHPQWRL